MKKWILIIIILLLAGGGAAWYFLNTEKESEQAEAVVQTATVEKGGLEVAITGSGTVAAGTSQDVTAANTVLVIESVSVASGEEVSKGDTLITFTNGDVITAPSDGEIASVLVASGQTASKGTILLRFTNEDDITSAITRSGNSNTDGDMSTNGGSSLIVDTVKVSQGEVVKKGAAIATFTDGSILQAPVAGTITSLAITSGDTVDSSSALLHITDYTSLQTTISVDELDISKVKVKQAAEITAGAFEDETFTGVVTSIAEEGSSESGTSSFDVTIQITELKSLKVGMSTEASIVVESKTEVLYIPVEAVYTSGGKKYVLNGNGEKTTVETGIANDMYVEIVSGLSEGDTVQLPQVKSSEGSSGFDKMQGGDGRGQMPSGDRPSGSGSGGPSGSPPSGGGQGGN
ncbi:MAG: efflux RND transporter periplasmic adaptor subunit [Bacillus sp. (in: firmicutes)]